MSEYKAGERVIYFKPTSGGGFLSQMIPAEFVKHCKARVKIRIQMPSGEMILKTVGRDSIERARKSERG